MSTLYLTCGLCGTKQASGLLSRAHWGHVDSAAGTLRACPKCKAGDDWETRLLASAGGVLERRSFSDDQAAAFVSSYERP